jgi:Arc/MetJ-type ribon-helix-helix transcriptional regulator/mRNA-degrading endonuclease YafQ of YafQ-DinJ toxin-antitoxin module
MSTLSVPLTPALELEIEKLVKNGYAPNKAAVVRRAIEKLAEDEAVNAVLIAEREISEGKLLRGDLRELAKKLS